MLEPCAVKVASTVLRGEGFRKRGPSYPPEFSQYRFSVPFNPF